MEKTITMEELDKVVEGLKTNKAPGTSGFTNEFYKEFHNDLKYWIMEYINFTKTTGKLSYLQRQGSITLIPKGQKDGKKILETGDQ